MLDTKGPEIRTGFFAEGKTITLKKDQELELTTDYSVVFRVTYDVKFIQDSTLPPFLAVQPFQLHFTHLYHAIESFPHDIGIDSSKATTKNWLCPTLPSPPQWKLAK